ncbi:MAG: 2-dehydro-3-deoxygalactonokinase [Brachybacterium sp.]|uniref:2-dehydro-3-deoxygalactonokinase n=1 Tax=Brachybacterium sp. TaxID=1891286 RepID=UPI002649581C|nr:2-dehydro-3-deoxygalactonokinase [Brachybacterium sp.]MDN5685885.1 2-dehydro-3-deoxygalactonokinase [Brachybacterium sp.]
MLRHAAVLPRVVEGAPALIAVDWGTTSCRFVLAAADGTVRARREGPGIGPLTAQAAHGTGDREQLFERALLERVGDWLADHPDIPLVMCGMVGAKHGWRDAGYRMLPADLTPGRDELVPLDVAGHRAYLVPGVMQRDPAPDVMRGEETQVLGALLADIGAPRASDALVVAPGTHSKWVRIAEDRIRGFRTYLTGDLFAALSEHTIVAAEIDDAQRPGDGAHRPDGTSGPSPAFLRGVDLALGDDRPSLSRHLFQARSAVLLGELASVDVRDFLSGLIIGDEVGDALTSLAPEENVPILLIASDELAHRYRATFDRMGRQVHHVDGDPATRGLLEIARQGTDATPDQAKEPYPA